MLHRGHSCGQRVEMRPFTPLAPWETTALSRKAPRILLAQCERSKSAPWQPPAASGRVPARLSRQMSGSAPARPSPAARPRMSSSAPAHPSRAGRRRVSGSPRTRSTLSSSLHVCQGRSATVPRFRSRLVLHGLRPPRTGIAPWPRAAPSQIFVGIREASPIHPAPTQRSTTRTALSSKTLFGGRPCRTTADGRWPLQLHASNTRTDGSLAPVWLIGWSLHVCRWTISLPAPSERSSMALWQPPRAQFSAPGGWAPPLRL
mmetsp:Transcript_11482/g.33704  ORF Transcript_11482/g.33704 Transcript_11482/m.33704 type:complete len:260 (-) Transcript_11482:244-1023(-)